MVSVDSIMQSENQILNAFHSTQRFQQKMVIAINFNNTRISYNHTRARKKNHISFIFIQTENKMREKKK